MTPHLIAAIHFTNITPRILRAAILHFHDIETLFTASELDLSEYGFTQPQIDSIKNPRWSEVEKTLKWAEMPNHFLIAEDSFPSLLKEIPDPPLILFVAGNKEALVTPQIAMVGARNASPLGLENAEKFAHYLASAGLTITSGLALGIDGASHRGALSAKGTTIAVTGTGLNHCYPASHRQLASEIINKGGALVSEFPLDLGALAYHFPRRNRIISGLSLGVLVVEAALKSGSMITVRFALEQGREVFAMPGSIHHPLAKGCHFLIREGAKLVDEAVDILSELGYSSNNIQKKSEKAGLGKKYTEILSFIGYEMTPIDMILCRSGETLSGALSILLQLELDGYIRTVSGGYIRIN